MITISMTQKQGLEPMPAAAQIIDRIGSRSAQIANGLIGRFRNVDGFEFAGTEQPSQFHRITAVGLYPVARTLRSHRGSYHNAGHPELAQPTRNDESTGACFVADIYRRIFSVRFAKSRQQPFDSVKIIADGSVEPHFPVSAALGCRYGY
jgi:hypothetical protein